jgi:hypothetical protein
LPHGEGEEVLDVVEVLEVVEAVEELLPVYGKRW